MNIPFRAFACLLEAYSIMVSLHNPQRYWHTLPGRTITVCFRAPANHGSRVIGTRLAAATPSLSGRQYTRPNEQQMRSGWISLTYDWPERFHSNSETFPAGRHPPGGGSRAGHQPPPSIQPACTNT